MTRTEASHAGIGFPGGFPVGSAHSAFTMPSWATAPDAAGLSVGDGTRWGPERSHLNGEVAMIRELVSLTAAACLAAPTVAGRPPCAFANAESYDAGHAPPFAAVGDPF